MRFKTGTVGLAMLVLLVCAPAALASTASLREGTTVVYAGDPGDDTVTLSRYTDNRGTKRPDDDIPYYIVGDDGGITSGAGCVRVPRTSTLSACRVTAGLKRYEINTGGGDDTVGFDAVASWTTSGATTGGNANLGPGTDRFSGSSSTPSADAIDGGAGNDTIDGGAGNDVVGGGAGNDQVTGQAGDDRLDGGEGDDSLEFAATGAAAGVGAGADDLRGGAGVDLLSYLDHTAAITLAIDGQPGDGSAGENDSVHADVETVIATRFADTLTGSGESEDLYGNGGNDTIDGGAGDDLLNGGTGDDVIHGGPGDDGVQGSAGGDLLDGGSGRDLFEGDNECTTLPCSGGADQILARDDEEDTVNCGVGADRATVDRLDVVATDSEQGCESIDRGALPAPAPAPALAAVAGATTASAPTMSIGGARGLRGLILKGMVVEVTCPSACRIHGRLILRKTVVAAARRTRMAGAVTRLRLKTTKAGRRRLQRRSKARMTLVVDVTDGAGTKTTLSKTLTFKARKPGAKQPY